MEHFTHIATVKCLFTTETTHVKTVLYPQPVLLSRIATTKPGTVLFPRCFINFFQQTAVIITCRIRWEHVSAQLLWEKAVLCVTHCICQTPAVRKEFPHALYLWLVLTLGYFCIQSLYLLCSNYLIWYFYIVWIQNPTVAAFQRVRGFNHYA